MFGLILQKKSGELIYSHKEKISPKHAFLDTITANSSVRIRIRWFASTIFWLQLTWDGFNPCQILVRRWVQSPLLCALTMSCPNYLNQCLTSRLLYWAPTRTTVNGTFPIVQGWGKSKILKKKTLSIQYCWKCDQIKGLSSYMVTRNTGRSSCKVVVVILL